MIRNAAAALILLVAAGSSPLAANSNLWVKPYTDELSEVTLRNQRAEVLGTYFAMTEHNWHDIYHSVSSEFRSDLWTTHLTRALVEMPDLTPEQRAIILQGIGLVATGVLDVSREHPEWERLVREPLDLLRQQAERVFEPEVAEAIFTQPYPAVSYSEPQLRQKWHTGDTCTCSTESDWCSSSPTEPILECTSQGDSGLACMPRQGCCGTFLQYDCDGICV